MGSAKVVWSPAPDGESQYVRGVPRPRKITGPVLGQVVPLLPGRNGFIAGNGICVLPPMCLSNGVTTYVTSVR